MLEQELDDSRSERAQKYRELRKREQQIDEFLKTFDEVKVRQMRYGLHTHLWSISELRFCERWNWYSLFTSYFQALEQASISESEDTIVQTLESISKYLVQLSQTSTAAAAMHAGGPQDGTRKEVLDQLKEELQFKASEVSKSEETAFILQKERTRLSQDLVKVDQLEEKVIQVSRCVNYILTFQRSYS